MYSMVYMQDERHGHKVLTSLVYSPTFSKGQPGLVNHVQFLRYQNRDATLHCYKRSATY